jgi:NAD(P)-dependent dehydrogenase (short-subunit alcohol dehydrogenase family)
MDLNLKEKVAIVTGAGRGIGRAIALTLGKEGASVVVNDIDLTAAKEVSKDISSLGSRSLAVKADVTDYNQVNMMFSQTLDDFGKVDILVNNAGVAYDAGGPIGRKLFENSLPEEWDKEIDLILYGTMNCIKAVLGYMIKQKSGRIVNIASDLGRSNTYVKGVSVYSAAKGGVIALTKSIAVEVAAYGITVNAVCPGLVRTTRASQGDEFYNENEKRAAGTIPLGRVGEPDVIAKLAIFLSSDVACWITGQSYSVNGGRLMI